MGHIIIYKLALKYMEMQIDEGFNKYNCTGI